MTGTRLLGRCLLGPLLLVGLAGCAAAGGVATPSSPSLLSPSRAVTTHDNVVATMAFSRRLLHAVPMPPGARELSHSPTAYLRRPSAQPVGADPTIDRTTWWTVPLRGEAFGRWLRSHVPAGLHLDEAGSGSVFFGSVSGDVVEQDQAFASSSTATHTGGSLRVASTAWGHGLAVRVDTDVSPRRARTVSVPEDTSSVVIRRTTQSLQPHSPRRTRVRTVTSASDIAGLVRLVDGLPGSGTTPYVLHCPAIFTSTSYSMTFAGPRGTYVASEPLVGCASQLTLTRSGQLATDRLDPGLRFTEAADSHLG